MNAQDVEGQLKSVSRGDDLESELSALTDQWSQAPDSFVAVEPILQFMESNPSLDYGTPGPLVHFMERFWRSGFEEKLVESIRRRPTSHTVWMLNRLINGTKSPEDRRGLMELLKDARANPLADEDARRSATDFLDFQR